MSGQLRVPGAGSAVRRDDLQHLGAAVMLCWAQLPLSARDQILRQADDVIGLTPVPKVRNEIVRLMLRHAKLRWAASLLPGGATRRRIPADRSERGLDRPAPA